MTCSRGCCASFAEHIRTINIGAQALPTRKPDVVRIENTEKQWDRDGEAYKRLRKNHVQPKHVDGSADFERRS